MSTKSIKYILFGIGIIMLGMLSNMFLKTSEPPPGGFFVILTLLIIPGISMVVGLFYLIKGLVTKE